VSREAGMVAGPGHTTHETLIAPFFKSSRPSDTGRSAAANLVCRSRARVLWHLSDSDASPSVLDRRGCIFRR